MKRFINKKAVAIGLTMGVSLGLAGTAVAYFTSTGAGNGTATAGSATTWTVGVTGDNASKDLVPVAVIGTGPSDTESYTITNASKGSQYLAQAVISIASVDNGGVTGTDNCVAADFSLGGNAVGTSFTQTIGTDEAGTADTGGPGVYSGTVSLQLVDDATNQDACQGAVVHLHVAAS